MKFHKKHAIKPHSMTFIRIEDDFYNKDEKTRQNADLTHFAGLTRFFLDDIMEHIGI